MKEAVDNISQADIAKSEKLTALGNKLFALDSSNKNIFAAEHYRQAILKNPSAYEALYMLGRCFQTGAPVMITDVLGTFFEFQIRQGISINQKEVEAWLFRKAILIKPDYVQAIYTLSTYLYLKDVVVIAQDLVGTPLEGADDIDTWELIVALCRKVLRLDAKHTVALCDLGMILSKLKYIKVEPEDLRGTPYEGQDCSKLKRESVILALFRKAYAINSKCTDAIICLTDYLIQNNIALVPEDLKGTRFEDQDLPYDRNQVLAELNRFILLNKPKCNSNYRRAIYNLARCIANGVEVTQEDLIDTSVYSCFHKMNAVQLEIAFFEKAAKINEGNNRIKDELEILLTKVKIGIPPILVNYSVPVLEQKTLKETELNLDSTQSVKTKKNKKNKKSRKNKKH